MGSAAQPGDVPADRAVMGSAVLASLTIPGRPEHVREARDLVVKALGELHPRADDAVLLTSELVTNAVMHSNSRCPGGTIRVVVRDAVGGVRVDVFDDGSDLSAPVVRGEAFASDGHGLFLVQCIADQWGYLRGERGTSVWFWLSCADLQLPPDQRDLCTGGRRTDWPRPRESRSRIDR